MKRLIPIFFIAVALYGCDEAVELDLKQVQAKAVIEAIVTDEQGKQFVRVTRSGGFYEQGNTQRITNATVSITDNAGGTMTFTHNPGGKADSTGYYLPVPGFAGVIGRIYTLHVSIDGQLYEASDTLRRVAPIDKLEWQVNRFREREERTDGKVFELLIYAREPQDTKDMYLLKYYRNDSLVYNNETDVYLFDDYGVGEKIEGIQSSVYYALNDKAKVELYSISRNGYLFYNDLFTVMNSDGGMFSPPPANPRTNLSNGAMGFFQVSAVQSKTILLDPGY